MSETMVKQEPQEFAAPFAPDPEIEAMMKAGVHLGHVKSKNHPAMQPYIFGVRNTISIIDLTKTKEELVKTLEFLRHTVAGGGVVLLVGTRPSAQTALRELAVKTGMPYYAERWIGGTLTNFRAIAKRVERLEALEKERASGGFEKYTKKERMMQEDEIARLARMFDGIRTLKRLPSAVFVVDATYDPHAVREARKMGIPVAGLADTNTDAKLINFPIPSNDDAPPAVGYMLGRVGEAIEGGLKERKAKEEAAVEAAKAESEDVVK